MDKDFKQYVIGMAGHIDHGKTALVQALTGINTDRLKEEKERGITIDLGFAHLSENVTIIDVPGHERLIKNMVAGVSTIDLVLFVVAADDGIMPQTREHLDIVKLLGIKNGIFVITKIDLVEPDWVLLVEEELRELLKTSGFADAPILKTSTVTGEGIKEVQQAVEENLRQIRPRADDGIFRLPIDRVFSKSGFGSVVTGSVLSGKITTGAVVEILPEKITARVRGLQSHDHSVEQVKCGYRAALNLAGVNHSQLYRGQVITLPDYYQPVEIFNARLTVLPDSPTAITNQMRLRLHLHTIECLARVILPEMKQLNPGESAYVQFRLEKPIYASFRDRFIIRQYSPQLTLGGGIVLETHPDRYRRKYYSRFRETLKMLESKQPRERLLAAFSNIKQQPFTPRELQLKTEIPEKELHPLIDKLIKEEKLFPVKEGKETRYFDHYLMERIINRIADVLSEYHRQNPGRSGLRINELITRGETPYPESIIEIAIEWGIRNGKFQKRDEIIALAGFEAHLQPAQKEKLEKLEAIYRRAGTNPPLYKEALETLGTSEKDFRELLSLLLEQGKIIFVEERLYFHRLAIQDIMEKVREFFLTNSELSVPQFKEITGTTRKYAIPLLTYLDNRKITLRQQNVRVPGPEIESPGKRTDP